MSGKLKDQCQEFWLKRGADRTREKRDLGEERPLAQRAAEGTGGAPEADGVEDRHDDHDNADLGQGGGPAGEDERAHGIGLSCAREGRRSVRLYDGKMCLAPLMSP